MFSMDYLKKNIWNIIIAVTSVIAVVFLAYPYIFPASLERIDIALKPLSSNDLFFEEILKNLTKVNDYSFSDVRITTDIKDDKIKPSVDYSFGFIVSPQYQKNYIIRIFLTDPNDLIRLSYPFMNNYSDIYDNEGQYNLNKREVYIKFQVPRKETEIIGGVWYLNVLVIDTESKERVLLITKPLSVSLIPQSNITSIMVILILTVVYLVIISISYLYKKQKRS